MSSPTKGAAGKFAGASVIPAAADVGPWPEPVRLGTSLVVRGSTAAPRR